MKYLGLILVVVVALVVGQVLARRINENDTHLEGSLLKPGIGDKFRSFLENLKITLREGNSTLGIPVLDPFKSNKMAFAVNEDLVKGTFEATDFNVTGLSGYKVDKADIAILARKLTLGLTWPRIRSMGLYKFNATAFKEINVYGDGEYSATITDLSFTTNLWVSVIGGVSIKKMETSISLGALELLATGILNDNDASKFICEVISDMAPELVKDYQKELTTAVNAIVMREGNKFLKGKSLAEIIAIIS